MRAVLLGTGSPPPNPKRRGPATLLTLGEEMFLVDAGSGVGAQLVQAGVRPYDWPRVRMTEIEEGKIFEVGGVTVSAFTVDHDPVRPAVGYRFEGGGRRVAVSGDTRPSENLIRWSRGVDCLIHECCEMTKTTWTPDCGWPSLEEKIRGLASYHTQPEDIGRVAQAAAPSKLVITHMLP